MQGLCLSCLSVQNETKRTKRLGTHETKRNKKPTKDLFVRVTIIFLFFGVLSECRGLVLDSKDNWKLVCFPYRKFFNFSEPNAATIDWNNVKVYEVCHCIVCVVLSSFSCCFFFIFLLFRPLLFWRYFTFFCFYFFLEKLTRN